MKGRLSAWIAVIAVATAVRAWNALEGPLTWGYDAWGHVAYMIFLDLYRAVPWADQGWSYFHPPLHYAVGWALAQFGSAEVLLRGLAVWGGLASLATAACAAFVVRVAVPQRPTLPIIAFASIAFLPVQLFMSPMPGNEMTLTGLTSLVIAAFVAFDRGPAPRWSADLCIGVLLGLAMLTKFTGLIAIAVVVVSIAASALFSSSSATSLARAVGRAALIVAVAFAVCAPYYARNVQAFGNPLQLSRDFALVTSVESGQPPGVRRLSDYVRFSPRMFTEPNPLEPHLLGSVFGTVYLNIWADIFRESDVERALVAERAGLGSATAMTLSGLIPTALAIFGAGLVARDIWRGRRRTVYIPIAALAGATVGAFCVFTWQVPIWSALKSSYLLGLSLPYAVFVTRAIEEAGERNRTFAHGLTALLVVLWSAAAFVSLEGIAAPRRADAPATGAVRFHFEEYDAARRVYGRLVAGAGYKVPWLENLAAVDLADGRPERARRLYARALASAMRPDAYRSGRLAVATALSGDREAAIALLDSAISRQPHPELLANRAALSLDDDLSGAVQDLRSALDRSPEIVPAWLHLAEAMERLGESAEANHAREQAVEQACRGPRGYPYGVGTGEVLEWAVGRRALLVRESGSLRVALPRWYRGACSRLRGLAGSRP